MYREFRYIDFLIQVICRKRVYCLQPYIKYDTSVLVKSTYISVVRITPVADVLYIAFVLQVAT